MTIKTLESFAPRHILVVDDDPMVVEILSLHYSALGFSVEYAGDGIAGLKCMELRRPDIVLCDRVMPGLSGADLLAAVRQRGADWQKMVFVFFTALTDRRDHYAMMPLRPDGYLHKPVDFAKADPELARILSDRLEKSDPQSEAD